YDVKMVDTSANSSQGFGVGPVEGNHPKPYNTTGLLTFATNYTGITQLVDRSRTPSIYMGELSCFDQPVLECAKEKNPLFPITAILCVGVINPNDLELKFIASFSFTSGTPLPSLPI